MAQYQGQLHKMATMLVDGRAEYALHLAHQTVAMHSLVGQQIHLTFHGVIQCIACGRAIKKSFQNGYCFPCTQRLAQCDLCIVKPERCHYHLGTCREPQWGEQHCLQPHYVYLANSSGIKVGISRERNIIHRWIDQGASEALIIAKVTERRLSGLLEVSLAQHVADKTNWRKMLKEQPVSVDLLALNVELMTKIKSELAALHGQYGQAACQLLSEQPIHIQYPMQAYPQKVTAINLDKTPNVEGLLLGIKGQYLILEHGVLNVRKFSGYQITLETEG